MNTVNMNYFAIIIVLLNFINYCTCQYKYVTKEIDVPLSHFTFDEANNVKFKLRYLVNVENWVDEKGPILVYCGNEGELTMFADNFGFLYECAAQLKAAIIFVEHRFYGKMDPFAADALKDIKYYGHLTIDETLEDFLQVINYFKENDMNGKKRPTSLSNAVILFGGSYGGMLAAWMKYKYSHAIAGAYASGATMLDFLGMRDNDLLSRRVTEEVEKENPNCRANIRKSWDVISKFVTTNPTWLTTNWNLFKPITAADIPTLFYWMSNIYVAIAVSNYPFESNFLMPLPPNPLREMCKPLSAANMKDEDLLKGIYEALSVYLFHKVDRTTKKIDWTTSASPKFGTRAWDIQACMELVAPISTTGQADMFPPNPFQYDEFVKTCQTNYKLTPNPDIIRQRFGGEEAFFKYSNIIFTNGLKDVWNFANPKENVYNNPKIEIVNLEGVAHMMDLFATNPNDPPGLKEKRASFLETFRKWMAEYDDIIKKVPKIITNQATTAP